MTVNSFQTSSLGDLFDNNNNNNNNDDDDDDGGGGGGDGGGGIVDDGDYDNNNNNVCSKLPACANPKKRNRFPPHPFVTRHLQT